MRKLASLLVLTTFSSCSCEEPNLLAATVALCIAPEDVVAFGDQGVRTASTRTVAVTNCGNVAIDALTASLAPVAGDTEALEAFQVVHTEVSVPIEVGARVQLPIRFRPERVGAHAVELTIETPDPNGRGTAKVQVTGNGAPLAVCDILVGPDPVVFGAVLLGEEEARDVTFTNQGTGSCALSGARVTVEHDEFFAVTTPPPAEVGPGESATATVRFSPTVAGLREGRLALVLGGSTEIEIDLRGNGISRDTCALFATPSPLALPRASVGFSATEAATLIESVGELPCTVTTTALTAGADDFAIVASPPSAVLAPGETALLLVSFDPSAAGPRAGTVAVSTAEGVTLEVPLAAFADPTPTCALIFDPGTVSFAPLGVGLSAEADVTIRNASNISCEIEGVALTPGSQPEFSLVSAPPLGTLAAGAEVTARVRFTAQLPSPSLGRLQLSLSGGVQSSVDLLGFGDFAELVLTPGFIPYGIVTEGCASDTVELTVTNVGPVAARLDQVGFTAETDPNFELLQTIPAGTFLGAGEEAVLRARMLGAPQPGSHHGNLELRATGAVDPRERSELTGTTESIEDASRTDVFTQRDRPIIDILFVIDNSGSMGQEQANLAANFSAFIEFTTELDIDYQIGVVTTEPTGVNAGRLRGPIITNSGSGASSNPVADFVAQASVGTNGSADEEGLTAAVLALTEPLISGANFGLVREGALLSIIFVSDEEDHSPGDVGGYLETLLEVKGFDANALVASAIAGDVPGGCDSPAGDAEAASRYLDVVTSLQGVFASICEADWATTMEEIGLGTFQALTRFQLSRTPDPATMVVTVNGLVLPPDALNGWSYDEESNSVRFNGTGVPEAGESIEVTYVAECIAP